MSELHGRLGGPWLGYDLRASWDGTHLRGRISGSVQGRDFGLTLRGGGKFAGFDVGGTVTPQGVEVRLGGQTMGDDLRLIPEGEGIAGRFSGSHLGKNVALRRSGDRLEGRIGGAVDGKAIGISLGDVPPELAALVAVCAYKVLEDDSAAAGAS